MSTRNTYTLAEVPSTRKVSSSRLTHAIIAKLNYTERIEALKAHRFINERQVWQRCRLISKEGLQPVSREEYVAALVFINMYSNLEEYIAILRAQYISQVEEEAQQNAEQYVVLGWYFSETQAQAHTVAFTCLATYTDVKVVPALLFTNAVPPLL